VESDECGERGDEEDGRWGLEVEECGGGMIGRGMVGKRDGKEGLGEVENGVGVLG